MAISITSGTRFNPLRAAEQTRPAVEMIGINKRFGLVEANRDVSMVVRQGSIHGIVGENGAGKSTLMNILYGFHRPDSGEIRVNGRTVRIRNPRQATRHGIGMVHQHFMLVQKATVLENMVLGTEHGYLLKPSLDQARAQLARLKEGYGLELDPDAVVGELSVGLQQRLEILKALYRGADILILDEPTSVLLPQESAFIFEIMRLLKSQGKTVIFITHKLREIMEVTDYVSVMRDGRMAGHLKTGETDTSELSHLMIGRQVYLKPPRALGLSRYSVLEVDKLSVLDNQGRPRVKEASFVVRTGEIVGLAGIAGGGQSELLEAVAGIRPIHSGRIVVQGVAIDRNVPYSADIMRRLALAHVPEDRKRMGLIPDFPAYESMILGRHNEEEFGSVLLNWKKIREFCRRKMNAYDIRPRDPKMRTSHFSGGNQQKLVLAREMENDADLILIGQPTRGVDIGAIEYIYQRLATLRDVGKGILLVSAELDEILFLSDRIVVMHDGRIVGWVERINATAELIGSMMTGHIPPGAVVTVPGQTDMPITDRLGQ